jgi:hypothetical protein
VKRSMAGRLLAGALGVAAATLQAGCASVVSRASSRMADNLTTAILNEGDPETVRQGAPAYLLLIDALIEGDPDSVQLLRAGARLYSAYTSAFVSDLVRSRTLSARGRDYGLRALCRTEPATCDAWQGPYDGFRAALARFDRRDVPTLYVAAAAWAGWIQVNSGDYKAIAEKARVEAMMQRVVTFDERYDDGGAHLYLGVLDTLLPPALGGRPEQGRLHFERAIALSGGRNLMGKVLFARYYARLVFDRELHDRLCREVLAADPVAPGLTLINTLAQQEAKKLLDQSDEFFQE